QTPETLSTGRKAVKCSMHIRPGPDRAADRGPTLRPGGRLVNRSALRIGIAVASLLVVACEVRPAPPEIIPTAAPRPAVVATQAPDRSCDFAVGNREVLVSASRRTQL